MKKDKGTQHWRKEPSDQLDPKKLNDGYALRALDRLVAKTKAGLEKKKVRKCTICGGVMDRKAPAQHCISCQTEIDNK